MNHGSLFSGIGGFDLAAEWMGWNNVFHCEWNEFGKKILKHYWPKSISYDDITKSDFTIHRGTIDILTGGFPCQPYSGAGLRKGKEDERHLWPEMLRAIREIQPTWVVGENVLGITNWNGGLVFNEVQVELEAEGYEVQAYVLPAAGVNAPHQRERVWFIAYSGKKLCNATITQNDSVKNTGQKSKKWSQNWDEFELGTSIGDTGIGFYNGTDFEPTVIRVDDGLSEKLDELAAYGNAIVPQVALQIFKSIAEYENLYNENSDCYK
jgi:DNA (cytosine-5)-methyltransferase 1